MSDNMSKKGNDGSGVADKPLSMTSSTTAASQSLPSSSEASRSMAVSNKDSDMISRRERSHTSHGSGDATSAAAGIVSCSPSMTTSSSGPTTSSGVAAGSSGSGAALRKLMVFVDGTKEADRAFYAALQWLRAGDQLSAVYVVDSLLLHPTEPRGISLFGNTTGIINDDDIEKAHIAREKVHQLIARYAGMAREARAHNVQAVAVATSGGRSISEEALYYAQQLHVDCILTGTRQQGVIKRFFMGSFSTYILNHSTCDVLIIKSDMPGRHINRSDECPIAKAALAAHRSLHEGNSGGFAGHSVPESTIVPSNVRTDVHDTTSSKVTTLGHSSSGNHGHDSNIAAAAGKHDDNINVATSGAPAAASKTSGSAATAVSGDDHVDVADRLRALAMHHDTSQGKRPPSPH